MRLCTRARPLSALLDNAFSVICLVAAAALFVVALSGNSNDFEQLFEQKAEASENSHRHRRSVPKLFSEDLDDKTEVVGPEVPGVSKLVGPDVRETEACTEDGCVQPFDGSCMSYDQVTWYLEELARVNVHNVELISFMSTFENRKIHMVIVKPYRQRNPRNAQQNRDRMQIWLEGGFEANNCLHTATLLQVIHKLATDCQENCENVYNIIPLANPDGYQFALTENKNWIKNREKIPGASGCVGVNLNRNFPPVTDFYKYGSSDPCSTEYRGIGPSLSGEVSTVIGLKLSRGDINLTLTLTGSGNSLTYPFALNGSAIPDLALHRRVGQSYADAIQASSGLAVRVGTFFEVVGPQSGTSMDFWTDHELAEFCFTAQLRPVVAGEFAKVLSASKEETMVGMNGMIDTIRSLP